LLGKQLPYIGIGMANFVILTLVVVFLLQVPMKGSLLTLPFDALLYITTTMGYGLRATGYGLLVSNLASNQLTAVLTIILTRAAILREREHGTLKHLLMMPPTSFEIVISKVWANGIVILVFFTLSMIFVVDGAIGVPFAGSRLLLLSGTVVYLFAAAAVCILLATIARSMAQYGLLCMITIIPMTMLFGGMSPLESPPDWLQRITWFLPSQQRVGFAQAIAFRGIGFDGLGLAVGC